MKQFEYSVPLRVVFLQWRNNIYNKIRLVLKIICLLFVCAFVFHVINFADYKNVNRRRRQSWIYGQKVTGQNFDIIFLWIKFYSIFSCAIIYKATLETKYIKKIHLYNQMIVKINWHCVKVTWYHGAARNIYPLYD